MSPNIPDLRKGKQAGARAHTPDPSMWEAEAGRAVTVWPVLVS